MGLNILIISNVAMIMEMFLVNVYATLSCSGKKKSALITWSYLVLFSAALFALIGYLIPEIALYALDDSYRLLSFTGVVYLIPLILLTKQPYKHTMVIFNTFWVYSLIIFDNFCSIIQDRRHYQYCQQILRFIGDPDSSLHNYFPCIIEVYEEKNDIYFPKHEGRDIKFDLIPVGFSDPGYLYHKIRIGK